MSCTSFAGREIYNLLSIEYQSCNTTRNNGKLCILLGSVWPVTWLIVQIYCYEIDFWGNATLSFKLKYFRLVDNWTWSSFFIGINWKSKKFYMFLKNIKIIDRLFFKILIYKVMRNKWVRDRSNINNFINCARANRWTFNV